MVFGLLLLWAPIAKRFLIAGGIAIESTAAVSARNRLNSARPSRKERGHRPMVLLTVTPPSTQERALAELFPSTRFKLIEHG